MAFENQQVAQPESDYSKVASEDPSYHAIKVYNMLEDEIWTRLDLLSKSKTIDDISNIAREIRVLFLRGDKVWAEIKKSIEIQASTLKIHATSFKYENEFSKYAQEILDYLKIALDANFLVFNGSLEEQESAKYYLELSPQERLSWLVKKIEDKILDATELWGELAAEIHFTMPINIKDTRDPFL